MNKTLTAVAVVLLTVTALFAMADYGESDGDTTYVQGTTVRHLTTVPLRSALSLPWLRLLWYLAYFTSTTS